MRLIFDAVVLVLAKIDSRFPTTKIVCGESWPDSVGGGRRTMVNALLQPLGDIASHLGVFRRG